MAKKRLRKTFPKTIDELLKEAAETGDYAAVHEVLEGCEPDARIRPRDGTILFHGDCTPELAAWAVARGTDVDAENSYGKTALFLSSFARFAHRLPPGPLIELGADVHHRDRQGQTALHFAADGKNLDSVRLLLERGADPVIQSTSGLTPLAYALQRLSSNDFAPILPLAQALLDAGDRNRPELQKFVHVAAERFEFHRAGFNKDSVKEVSDGLEALCALFDVTPPARRVMHDGQSDIELIAGTWQEQYADLWERLIPSSGPCATVQGEVIRITGRISDELHRNGGVNWRRDHTKMAKALPVHLGTHASLDPGPLGTAKELVAKVRHDPDETTEELKELAVQWVGRNPRPYPLPKPDYSI